VLLGWDFAAALLVEASKHLIASDYVATDVGKQGVPDFRDPSVRDVE
jgi:hypothetical protein